MSIALRVYWPQILVPSQPQKKYFLLGWCEKNIKHKTSSDITGWNIYVIAIWREDRENIPIFKHLSTCFPSLCIIGYLQFPTSLKKESSSSLSPLNNNNNNNNNNNKNDNNEWFHFFSPDVTVIVEFSEHSHLPLIVDVQISSLKETSNSAISPHINIILYQPTPIDQKPSTHNLLHVVHCSWLIQKYLIQKSFPLSIPTSTTTSPNSIPTRNVPTKRSYCQHFFDWIILTLLWLLNMQIPFLNAIGIRRKIKDLTLFGQQLERRVSTLRSHNSNALLSFVLDVLCGWFLIMCTILLVNTSSGQSISQILTNSTQFNEIHSSLLNHVNLSVGLEWIMKSRPAGVKLNPSLASFLGQVLLIYVQWWLNVMSELGNHILVLFGLLLSFSLGGLSLTFALLVDIIMLHCCHILWLYSVLARIYHLQFSLLLSLWFLFRGKKWNVLKQRLDSCDYSIDQLLLGTLLFTILFFLLPTTWAFYLYFLIAYALVLVIHTLTCIVLELCNHFPFYSLFQYLFMKNTFLDEPSYVYISSTASNFYRMTYLRLKLQRFPLHVLLRVVRRRLVSILRHFVSLHTIKAILTGEKISPVQLSEI